MNNVKYNVAYTLIKKELANLDVSPACDAYHKIFNQCIEAYDVLTIREIKDMVAELCELYPVRYFR